MVTWFSWGGSNAPESGRWRMVQRKLGRGLDFLISGAEGPDEEITQVPLSALRANPFQPRREFVEEDLAELAASIREHGVLQPIVVRRQGDAFELVAGERRWRACAQLGLGTIPALVRDADDNQMLELALVENVQRADLNPMELARAYSSLQERLSLTQEQAAKRIGISRSALANVTRLLDLPSDLQEFVSRGTLTMGHARALLAIGDASLQRALAGRIIAEGWSVRDIERAVQAPAPAPAPENTATDTPADSPSRPAHFDDLEAQLRERLGTRVRLQHRNDRGRIVIEYFTRDELERLLDLLLDGAPTS